VWALAAGLKTLNKSIAEIKRAKRSQSIKDLDDFAKEFGCAIVTTTANENRIYYSCVGQDRVTVAIPHHGNVREPYVRRFIRMLESIVEQAEREQGENGGTLNE
jgi:hypothetical protein